MPSILSSQDTAFSPSRVFRLRSVRIAAIPAPIVIMAVYSRIKESNQHMDKKNYEAPVTEVVVVNTESGLLTVSPQGVEGSRSSYGTAVEESWN